MTAIHKSMSEAVMSMKLQVRSLACLPRRDPEPLVQPRKGEARRLRTVKLAVPHKFSGGFSRDVLNWVFQLQLVFANSTEFQCFSHRFHFPVTLFRDEAMKWWRAVHHSVELTSCEDLYAIMIKPCQP